MELGANVPSMPIVSMSIFNDVASEGHCLVSCCTWLEGNLFGSRKEALASTGVNFHPNPHLNFALFALCLHFVVLCGIGCIVWHFLHLLHLFALSCICL